MLKPIHTTDAPAAIGPYAQAIVFGNLLFLSGQLPSDPQTGQIVSDDIALQTEQCLNNAKAIIAQAGSSMDKVIKTTVFLKDLNFFGVVNEVYGRFFSEHKPARACVEVARLPKDAKVEIEMVVGL